MPFPRNTKPAKDRPTVKRLYYVTPVMEDRLNKAFVKQINADPTNVSRSAMIRDLLDIGLKSKKL